MWWGMVLMAPEQSGNVHENGNDGGDDKNRVGRHPRWTRQETFVLIQGKKIAENRGRRGRRSSSSSALGSSDLVEPKWDAVSSYCTSHGVHRGPVQCRKRWSNLVGDFKKIKTWESQVGELADQSFWMMRNDLRRERKLPGFFDREVYDVLDGRAFSATAFPLALVSAMPDVKSNEGMEVEEEEEEEEEEEDQEEEEEEEEEETVFDSSRQAAAEDGLFSDSEQLRPEQEKGTPPASTHCPTQTPSMPLPISQRKHQKFFQGSSQGKQPCSGSMAQERRKRRRVSVNVDDGRGETTMEDQLVKVLERNSKMLNAQLEAQKVNFQLDRDQRKDHANGLIAALSKLTDAIARIADKL